jgi:hypothetical protein
MLTPKLTRKSIEIHKKLGFKGREYLENILDENLEVTFGREVFDRYGRPLVYLGDGQGYVYYQVHRIMIYYFVNFNLFLLYLFIFILI